MKEPVVGLVAGAIAATGEAARASPLRTIDEIPLLCMIPVTGSGQTETPGESTSRKTKPAASPASVISKNGAC